MILPMRLSELDRFQFQYARDLMPISDGGILVRPDEAINGRLVILLQIGEETTARDLRKAEKLLLQWQQRLNEFQGRLEIEHNEIFLSIQKKRQAGESFAKIAADANQRIAERLREYSCLPDNERVAFKGRNMLYHARQYLLQLNAGQCDLGKGKGRNGQKHIREKDKQIDSIIKDALRHIRANEAPFDCPDYPLSRDDVVVAFSDWKRKTKNHVKT